MSSDRRTRPDVVTPAPREGRQLRLALLGLAVVPALAAGLGAAGVGAVKNGVRRRGGGREIGLQQAVGTDLAALQAHGLSPWARRPSGIDQIGARWGEGHG